MSADGSALAEPIRIAAVFAKTGIAAEADERAFRGVRLACEEINAAGGLLGRPVRLIEIDTLSSPLGAKNAAQRAIGERVSGVIGASWSSQSLAMAPVLQKAGIPMITSASTNPQVTRSGDFIFRVCFTDDRQGEVLGRFAAVDLEARTAVLLTMVDSGYSVTLSKLFKRSFERHGGTVIGEASYLGKAVDFSDSLKRVAQLDPDVLFVPGYIRDSALIVKQAALLGNDVRILGGDGWGPPMVETAGDAVNGHYFARHWYPGIDTPGSEAVRKSVSGLRGRVEELNEPLVLAYDATMVLADAVQRAGSASPVAVRDALSQTREFPGISGTITFDSNGDPVGKAITIVQFVDTKLAFIKVIELREQQE